MFKYKIACLFAQYVFRDEPGVVHIHNRHKPTQISYRGLERVDEVLRFGEVDREYMLERMRQLVP